MIKEGDQVRITIPGHPLYGETGVVRQVFLDEDWNVVVHVIDLRGGRHFCHYGTNDLEKI